MKEWKKCKKKPVIVEYREVQPIHTIYEDGDKNKQTKGELVKTLAGIVMAIVGKDFIIKGIHGELYPITKELFYETYDVIE